MSNYIYSHTLSNKMLTFCKFTVFLCNFFLFATYIYGIKNFIKSVTFRSFDTLLYEENNFRTVKMKNEIQITDEVALSIRSLWHIDSMIEKKRIINYYDNLNRLFLLIDNHPDLFSKEELLKYRNLKEKLSDEEKKLISEIFTSLHLGFITEPMEYSVEEVTDLYNKGLYFTKDELEEMIEYQFSKTHESRNLELVLFLGDLLEKHLFFDTIEEAETVWNNYFSLQKKETNT